MEVYLVDGTYELFRAYFALPALESPAGKPVGAVHGLIQSLLRLIRENGVTHIGCAFDSVIPSFRNELFPGYKTGEGTPPELLAQFETAERAAAALGICVWPMVEFEADDAIAAAAAQLRTNPAVERVVICSPDKDLAQLVEGERVVCLDRRRGENVGEDAVIAKYGVPPQSIPDLLALTGDTADGIPGLPRWGAKSTAAVLSRYGHLEDIPTNAPWDVPVRGAAALQGILSQEYGNALLYRQLATLSRDVPIDAAPEAVEWRGAYRAEYEAFCRELGSERLATLPHQWADEA
jgi:5'-3' exonuclease